MTEPPAFSWVEEGFLAAMGRPYGDDEMQWLRDQGIELLISLTEEPLPDRYVSGAGLLSYHIPIPDMTAPELADVYKCLEVIENGRMNNLRIGIHCAAGQGRTGTMIACYFVSQGEEATAAIEHIRRLRPGSIETEDQEELVRRFGREMKN